MTPLHRGAPARGPGLLGLVLALAFALSGCIPSQPSASSWRDSTETAVGDVVSEVATAQLTLEHELKDRFVGRYSAVTLVYAEEAAAKASDKVSTKQPPKTERKRYDTVTTKLSDATDLITEARLALVDGERGKYPKLIDELSKTAKDLQKVEGGLKTPSGGGR